MSNLHHQTANASTNTPIHENLCLSPFFLASLGSKSPTAELSSLKLSSSSTVSLASKAAKPPVSSSSNTTDPSSFNFTGDPSSSSEKKNSAVGSSELERWTRFSSRTIRWPRRWTPVDFSFPTKRLPFFSPALHWAFSRPFNVSSLNEVSLGIERSFTLSPRKHR